MDTTSGIASFTMLRQLQQAIEEEHYPHSVKCIVSYTQPDQTVQQKTGVNVTFSFDVKEGTQVSDNCGQCIMCICHNITQLEDVVAVVGQVSVDSPPM